METYIYTAPGVVAGIVPNDAEHIFFDGNQHCAMGKDYPTAHYIEIRGITYGVNAYLHRWKDGTWNIGSEEDSYGTRLYRKLYMKRVDGSGDASDAARRKASEIITEIVRKWASDNPDALVQAQRKDTEEKLQKVQAKIAELQADLKAWEADAQALQAQLAQPGTSGPRFKIKIHQNYRTERAITIEVSR